ncbi:MAG: tRNA 2-thiocytidine biosynthesis protein TtcA [Euryarchaeota archaeon]|nr:tRNA 2-thiocytidine biosynthesis protein TtcA [Euryarchaeota archaeon]
MRLRDSCGGKDVKQKMTKCDKCQCSAIIYQRYSGMHLCREHFEDDVHRKIREGLRKTGLFGPGSRIAVGLDGGRKSATLAFVLKNLFIHRRDIDLLAIIIDEGKKTSPTADQAAHVAEQLGMAYIVKSQPLLQDLETPHTVQSARKRELLLAAAKENQARILATGETLDDEARDIFISYLQGDVDAVVREGSLREEQSVAWIKPLRRIPEKEVRLYAIGRHLGFDDAGEMPNTAALRRVAKRLLCDFDCRHPGTNYSLLRGLEKVRHMKGPTRAKPLSKDGK